MSKEYIYLHLQLVTFGSMALFWELPAIPYMESLREGEQQKTPRVVQNRAGVGDNTVTF